MAGVATELGRAGRWRTDRLQWGLRRGGEGAFTPPVPKTRHNDRRCCASGETIPPDALAIRFVRSPDGVAVPDLKGVLPGRGAWVLPRRALVERAARSGLARSFRERTAADGLADRVAGLLRERALAQLGLARRAGQVVLGFDAVRAEAGALAAYLSPEDAGADGVTKIAAKLAAAGTGAHIPLPAQADEVAAALGLPSAVHVGLRSGRAGLAAREACSLWAGYDE